MKGFIFIAALLHIFLTSPSLADENLYNPLISYREQLKTLRRDCQERKYDKDCANIEQKLTAEMEKLKEVCKSNQNDERCGAVMKERKDINKFQAFCMENPHAKKCVVRRTRARRREKMKRLFCNKNPEENRCKVSTRDRSKRGFAFYCKSHPDDRRCKLYLERKAMLTPPKDPETHGF